jgi:hypothetical protein
MEKAELGEVAETVGLGLAAFPAQPDLSISHTVKSLRQVESLSAYICENAIELLVHA